MAGGAGGVIAGYLDGTGTVAKFDSPYRVAVDSAENVCVADFGNHMIRKINAAGER